MINVISTFFLPSIEAPKAAAQGHLLLLSREKRSDLNYLAAHKVEIQTHHLADCALGPRSLTKMAPHRPQLFIAFESLATLALHRAASDSVG
jgi:hypothetical protein